MAWAARTSRWESPSNSTNSIVAPRSVAARRASVTRCSGWPCVPASPREHTTKCAGRPISVSCAITPPQPNSMSSGCAPKASTARVSGGELSIGFIRLFDLIPADKSDVRRFIRVEIGLLTRAGHIVRTPDHRLHPAQPSVSRGTDLLLGVSGLRENDEGLSALVQPEHAVVCARARNFAFV